MIKYPQRAKVSGFQFVLVCESDGSISDVKVVKGVDVNTDKEVKRLIQNMPRWKPAVQDGKKVKVRRTIPIAL